MNRLAPIVVLVPLLAALPALPAEDTAAAEETRERCSAELTECLDWMAENYTRRGWVGLQLETEGYVYTVTRVHDGSPAQGRVRPGDVLVAVNGVEFAEENREKLLKMQGDMKPGAKFTYTLKRGGKRRNVEFVLVEMPYEVVALYVGMHLLTDHVELD